MSATDDAARAIRLLLLIRDELELAARPPGDRIVLTRQINDSHINDLDVVAKLIRKLTERP